MSVSYDLLIVTDATASMGSYLDALRTSIPEILALAKLSGAFSRLGVIAYKDYSDPPDEIIAWSGWNPSDLAQFAEKLEASGGGDFPEAAKTALIRALQAVDKESRTLILWYADAPPHHICVQSRDNDVLESKAFPEGATDWVKLCHIARRRNCTVFSFTPNDMMGQYSRFYVLLSELTGGICINSNAHSNSSALISRLTLDVILQWMGQSSEMESVLRDSVATYSSYKTPPLEAKSKLSNEGAGSHGYLPPSFKASNTGVPLVKIRKSTLQTSHIPLGLLASQPFSLAKRFADPSESSYRDLVYASLTAIINSNVFSLTYNPIFGQLWRAVCKDNGPRKDALLNAFSHRVGLVTDPVQKAGLQQWLNESFDATEEIERIIAGSDPGSPMVYLDLDADIELTRVELLEVSKSCYSGTLKKVASVFTHLKLVETDVKLTPGQRSIPLSLPPRELFRILPHLVVPGTLYPPRAASITAVLSLITAVPFLREPATALLATLKGTWLNLEVPENISFDCARFLLSAPESVVLTKEERSIYEAMRRYQLIELNLESAIEAHVPWTPDKTRGVGDRKVRCKQCLMMRSVTIMSHSACGLCVAFADKKKTKAKARPEDFVTTTELESCWVECSKRTCRAQYVVENVSALRIRPRCYYCRNNIRCPWLECTRCSNRVIVPPVYRSTEDMRRYLCPACDSPESTVATTVVHATSTKALIRENGVSWLGFSADHGLFEGKTAFKLMQVHGPAVFGETSTLHASLKLTLNGKQVSDPARVVGQIERRVGRGEVELESCTLCFEEMSRSKLFPACGRSGCAQRVDEDCLREWYGKNEPGKLLNLMQFTCPFCRRKPTVKVLARYNWIAASLGDLQRAMDDRQFFYAWCLECGFAKRAYERLCCQGDRVPAVDGFWCADCLRPPIVRREVVKVEPLGKIKACPKCQVLVEKIDGCNHITCQCGQHFCFACGVACTAGDVYVHMQAKHGGAFGV